jgi:molybdopterin-binding protein
VPVNAAPTGQRGRVAAPPDLSLAEHVCLAVVVEAGMHGWAIGTLLAPDGEIGRVWSLSRPLTYRAIDGLVDEGLVVRRARTTGHGRDRAVLAATAAGRRAVSTWLDTPVRHLRDVRTELLVKVTLRSRAGIDNAPLLAAQRTAFDATIEALTLGSADDLVAMWRREHARAVRRFLDEALRPTRGAGPTAPEMRLSARNQLGATVVSVQRGELMASVKAVLGDGQKLTATITQEAADDLDIAAGDSVLMIVKATEVMVAKE